ncbi:hypothetical protein NC652_040786 [Populus alba x Populus x berolinensis]|nr:hypothetical protein NC652_040786 [Populus alba x Populus x berolinensis]
MGKRRQHLPLLLFDLFKLLAAFTSLDMSLPHSYEWRRSGQIPAFGNWDQANELPITQYFESARQAGLIRFSTTHNSSGECGHQDMRGDLYASDINKPSRNLPPPVKTRMREKRGTHGKEQRKQGKVCDVTEPAKKQQQQPQPTVYHKNKISQYSQKRDTVIVAKAPVKPPKAIDEDLYKISPELLRSSKRVSLLLFLEYTRICSNAVCAVPRVVKMGE